MPINTWRGTCRYCGKRVGKKKGRAGRSNITGQWLVWHVPCEPPEPVDLGPAEPPRQMRLPYSDA